MKIILASASPRRRELMKLITDDFECVAMDVDETLPENYPYSPAVYLAELKAKKAAELYPDCIVIGCDTVVKVDGHVLGKPKDVDECRKFLRMLSGKVHSVTTSFCIIGGGNFTLNSRTTSVTFRKLSEKDIEWYISTGEPFDKAGGYGIQGKGSLLIKNMNGDYFNVVGLPVSALNQELKQFIKSLEENNMNTTAFHNADILIPENVDMNKWSVIACDQYTSEPEYWNEVYNKVGDAPSTLNLILPEIFLENDDVSERIENIHNSMDKYISDGVFKEYKNAMVYVERVQSNGIIRRGIVGAIDLEKYDFSKGSRSEVRATEATVIERIPPRIKVRQGATLELPHIMILIDDPENTVIEPLAEQDMEKLYDFELMQNGGSIKGYLVDTETQKKIDSALCELADFQIFNKKYNLEKSPVLLYAMGDGNHSLATAKEFYEQLKKSNPDIDFSGHPARYALAEIVNLHSDALKFEAIHRLVYDVDCDKLISEMTKALELSENSESDQYVIMSCNGTEKKFYINKESSNLSVGSLQNFLDGYIKSNGGKIDYIHGTETVKNLAEKHNGIGFILPDMDKSQLFPTVIKDGALPRKTFSMGHAEDKRFYIEARKITE
ncbi:MAG: Maf family nucleotide pyrophosphatase [Prevotella sp.]|nr:Maf family nucleotide pyrophosphatase [Alistipes senegalensis]MCM1358874.1 Maf family nucleotide pyrophosphatase [Prevotella sp.]